MAGFEEPAIYSPEFADTIIPANGTYPFYFSENPSLIAGLSDKSLSLIAPLVAYWVHSLIFHALDVYGTEWAWLAPYRIHESAEVKAKNLVSKSQVVWAVLVQQAIQTILGIIFVDSEETSVDHREKMARMSPILVQSTLLWMGNPHLAQSSLQRWGSSVLYFAYWWAIPTAQILFAFFVLDTWQYFLHRYFHTNKFLYRHFHSWHHRLYVPYAFGALYNHPFEGFLFDSLGAVVAENISRLSIRQTVLLFTFSSLKTVDDHCGYSLPFDPLQILFSNNADYHDIHHQAIGIKKNFSQPFFIHWDTILGTKMTRKEVEERTKKSKRNGLLKENGHANEHVNGHTNGHANGHANGNGDKNGNGNGVANGDHHKLKVE
ncbi:hypothetical protein FRC14_006166 [Serendipita sp. 396]|nr:hypothetical protein FRC14_006166 [Serendipita sp. 396]